MIEDTSSFLATRYLVPDPQPSKKRSAKASKRTAGLLIADDDEMGWIRPPPDSTHLRDDPDAPLLIEGSGETADFRKSKISKWKSIGVPYPPAADAPESGGDRRQFDGLEREELSHLGNEGDIIQHDADATMTQSSKRRRPPPKESRTQAETVYRDATGRRVDISLRRAEARRSALEAEEKTKLDKSLLLGDVQVHDAQRRSELLQEAKTLPLARGADDEELNRELKAVQRWNDPSSQFLSMPVQTTKPAVAGTNRPVYKGPSPPNRYGIRPGYRWDGVDRGIGFETDYFKAINQRARNKSLAFAWQTDE